MITVNNSIIRQKSISLQYYISVLSWSENPVCVIKYYVHLKLVLLLIGREQCLSLINLKFLVLK